MTRSPRVTLLVTPRRGPSVDGITSRGLPLLLASSTVVRATAVLFCRAERLVTDAVTSGPTSGRTLPLGPRDALSVAFAVGVAIVVGLLGTALRVREGAARVDVVSSATVAVACVVAMHPPSAQVGVVLPGVLRTGTVVELPPSGERELTLAVFSARDRT